MAADLILPLLQARCESESVPNESSNEITIGSGVQRDYHGWQHRYEQKGWDEELGNAGFVFLLDQCYTHI